MASSDHAVTTASMRPRHPSLLVALVLGVTGVLALPVIGSPPLAFALTTTMTISVHDAHHVVVSGTKVGAPVHARVSLSGTPRPTGTVTVVRYGDAACAGKGAVSDPVKLLLGTADVSGFPFLPTATGTYAFGVSYKPAAGSPYTATHACKSFTVAKATPSVTIVFRVANGGSVNNVELGQLVQVDMTVVGPKGVPVPTGNVTLRRYSDDACTQGSTLLSTSVLQAGATRVTWWAQALGTVWYRASYAGDARYTSRVGACTRLSVTKATPILNGAIHDPGHVTVTSVVEGVAVHAFIRVRGFMIEEAPETLPTGQIRGIWFTTGACTTLDAAFGPVLLESGQVDIVESTRLMEPGTYGLRLQYLGDAVYRTIQGPCLKVTVKTAATTAPTAKPTAKPTGASSGPPAGSPSATEAVGPTAAPTSTVGPTSEPVGASPSPAASPMSPQSADSGATVDPLMVLVAGLLLVAAIVVGFVVGGRRRRGPTG